jgi:hypothetical protein
LAERESTDNEPAGSEPFVAPDARPNITFKRVRREVPESPPTSGRRRWRLLVTAGVVLVLLATAGWVGVRGRQASGHLHRSAQLFGQLQRELQRGDTDAGRVTLASLQRELHAARDETGGPAWRMSSALPKLGDDLDAVHTIAAALDDLARDALPALVDVAAGVESAMLAPVDGRFDVAVLAAAAPRITRAAEVIQAARDRIAAIRTAGLAPQVRTAVPELLHGLDRASSVAGPAARAARLLPSLLGASGPRSYLVLFQNLAEVRATGGMPGAFVVVEADHGAVRIVDQGTAAATLRTFDAPVLPLSEDLADLYTERLGMFPADVNLTPDFPTAAGLAREMYRVRTGRTVDGVLATDPVALSYLLRATGPVQPPTGAPLTADTAVRTLLSEVYLTMPAPQQQDAYFAGAARAVFDALIGRRADPRLAVLALARAAEERRLLMWSANPAEQEEIGRTVLAGALPTDDGAAPTVGVFLNDGSGAKLGYYLTHAATLTVGACMEDGTRELRLRVELGSTAPSSGLPPSVLGLGLSGAPYTVRTNVVVFSPVGGAVVDATLDGAPVEMGTGVEQARAVSVATVDLPPGVRKTLDMTILTDVLPQSGAGASEAMRPVLRTTPGITPWSVSVTPGPPCGK